MKIFAPLAAANVAKSGSTIPASARSARLADGLASALLIRRSRLARKLPASHAASVSEVTSQVCGRPETFRGVQQATRPCLSVTRIPAIESAQQSRGHSEQSARPYCCMARSAMRCAATSSNCIFACMPRTASAKTPPPGTSTSGPAKSSSAASQPLNSGDPARLPPIFTTSGDLRESTDPFSAARRRYELGEQLADFAGLAFALDLDPDAAFDHVELFGAHGDRLNSRMGEKRIGNALGERLDEIDMATAQDQLDRIDDQIIGEDVAHIFGLMGGATDIDVDIEAHALRAVALMVIGADGDRQDEIVDEDAI